MSLAPLLLVVCAASVTQDRRLGPSSAETVLVDALADATIGAADPNDLVARLRAAAPPGAADADLARALRLAADMVVEAPFPGPEALPRSPGLLRLLARRFPVATPSAWAPDLERARTGDAERDAALLELLARCPGEEARALLRGHVHRILTGTGSAALAGVVLDLWRTRAGLEDLADLWCLRRSADPAVANGANQALWDTVGRCARDGRAEAVARSLEALAAGEAEGNLLRLEAAGRLLGESTSPELARPFLEAVRARTAGRRDTGSLIERGEAYLGLACVAILEGHPLPEVEAHLAEAATPPRPVLEDERDLLVQGIRAELLRRLVVHLQDPGADLDDADFLLGIRQEYDRNLLDEAWFGPFGPHLLRQPLRRQGRADALRGAIAALVEAIEATAPFTGFGLRDRREDQEERPLSWIFLTLAELLLEDQGDPEAALAMLRWRVTELHKMSSWSNLDLLVNAEEMVGQAELYTGDAAACTAALDAALETARSLRQSFEEQTLLQLDRGEVPAPPARAWIWRDSATFHGVAVRALVLRSTAHAVLEGDPRAAAADLFAAGELWSCDDYRWTAVALDQARRGFADLAARSAALVETWQDRLYDRACIAAFAGQADRATRDLRRHLAVRRYTPAGRALERAYMARDPDLAAVRDHPEFPRD